VRPAQIKTQLGRRLRHFRSIIYSQIFRVAENLAKIDPIDVEIIGPTEIVKNKYKKIKNNSRTQARLLLLFCSIAGHGGGGAGHIGTTCHLNDPCTAAMRPSVELL